MMKIIIRLMSLVILMVALNSSVHAASKYSCENFAAWVKPLQSRAIEDRQGNLKPVSLYNAVQAFEEYKILFEDENFIPYFGESFDQLGRWTRSRIYKKMKNARKQCKERTEPDIRFYMSLYPDGRLSRAFTKRRVSEPEMSYEYISSYVEKIRLTSSNECEKLTSFNFESYSSDSKQYNKLKQPLDGERILRSCKEALARSPNPTAHIRYAKALHLVGNQRKRPVRQKTEPGMDRFFRSNEVDEIIRHTKIAVLAKEPTSFLFAEGLKNNAFQGASEIRCGLIDQCSLEALKVDPRNVIAERKVNNAWKEANYWRVKHRYNFEGIGQISRTDKEIAESKKQHLQRVDSLFALAKEMHAIFGAKYAYSLAEMAIFDSIENVTYSEVISWLKEARPFTSGMSEALEARLYESRDIKLGKSANNEEAKLIASLWQASAAKGNPYAQVRLLLDNEASSLSDLALYEKLDVISPRKYEKELKNIDLGYSQFWIDMADLELDVNLGPLAFRMATSLVQEKPDAVPSEKAIEYYKTARRSGIQKAAIALGYLYKHGKGVPKSTEWARHWFSFALHRPRSDVRLGVLGYDPKLTELAARERDEMKPKEETTYSSTDLLLAVGLAILILGNSEAHSDAQYTPSTTNYDPPPVEMWEMNGLLTGNPWK